MLRDERLQKVICDVDSAPDRERVRGVAWPGPWAHGAELCTATISTCPCRRITGLHVQPNL